MLKINKLALSIAMLFALLFSSIAMAGITVDPKTGKSDPSASYLFIQTAEEGYLKAIPGKTGIYTLTLKNVNPYVTYFADRPSRKTGILEINKFLSAWQTEMSDNFQQNAPNVGLDAIKMNWVFHKQVSNVILALTNPVYDANNKTLTYTAKVISDNKTALLQESATLHHIALFFDNFGWCPGCCCG